MGYKLLRPCKYSGCKELTSNVYCDKHKRTDRASASKKGYNSSWRKAAQNYLLNNPLCKSCLNENRLIQSEVVDHIKPHKGDYDLFWNVDNWQALCKRCHDKKTAKNDGGFGNCRK